MHFPLLHSVDADRYYIYLELMSEMCKGRLTYERVVQRIQETTKDKVKYLTALTEVDIQLLRAVGLFEQQDIQQAKAMLKEVFTSLEEEKAPSPPHEKEFRALILRPQALIM